MEIDLQSVRGRLALAGVDLERGVNGGLLEQLCSLAPLVTTIEWQAVAKLLAQYEAYKAAATPSEKVGIGDAMFYDDPIIWILYKNLAYVGTAGAVLTLGGLRHHAADEQDICGRRWRYFVRQAKLETGIDFTDEGAFPDQMSLIDFANTESVRRVCDAKAFMEGWRAAEYFKDATGRVAKWENT